MSNSLNRIRSLITEIEQIQKQGQKSLNLPVQATEVPQVQMPVTQAPVKEVVPVKESAPAPAHPGQSAPSVQSAPPVQQVSVPEVMAPAQPRKIQPAPESRVSVRWSAPVTLELQLPESDEVIEMKKVGDWIEIRFKDGKSFHIPFKSVA
jgi:hypothetical protein